MSMMDISSTHKKSPAGAGQMPVRMGYRLILGLSVRHIR